MRTNEKLVSANENLPLKFVAVKFCENISTVWDLLTREYSDIYA